MQINDEERDQDLDVEDTEVYAEALSSDEDLPGLGDQCQNDGDLLTGRLGSFIWYFSNCSVSPSEHP